MQKLIFVDKELIIGLSVPYLGSEISAVKQTAVSGGVNWLLQSTVERHNEQAKTVLIRDMRPEDIARQLSNYIPKEYIFDNVDACVKYLARHDDDDLIGKIISVQGVLKCPGIDTSAISGGYNPTTPPNIQCNTFDYNMRTCFACELTNDSIKLPVYFSKDAIIPAGYAANKNVSIIGSLGWVPYYNAGKQISINLILCGAALWVG